MGFFPPKDCITELVSDMMYLVYNMYITEHKYCEKILRVNKIELYILLLKLYNFILGKSKDHLQTHTSLLAKPGYFIFLNLKY